MIKATARAAAVGGILLLSILAAPAAVAGPPDRGEDGPPGASAEHRNDAEAPGRQASDDQGPAAAPEEPAAQAAAGTSAPHDEPQPPSSADFSGNGANQHGPYDSTRDGSASDNGLGDGEATGRPCAGCVGKADNKNPAGQLPNATDDGNAGYECDTNSGIARTNPAHTGCTVAASTSTPPGGAAVLGVTLTAPAPAPAAEAVAPAAVAAAVRPAALAATGTRVDVTETLLLGATLLVAGSLLLLLRARPSRS